MTQEQFLTTVHQKANELQLNPLLLLSGIEGLYTFRNVPLNTLNYSFLDSLILTIFALRVGDQFHEMAAENLESTNMAVSLAAERELTELSEQQIQGSQNTYLQSFAQVLQGKTPIRFYHVKALEVAAFEIQKAQRLYQSDSISFLMLHICKTELQDSLNLEQVFG
jgi:hypothetical protein